MRWSACARAFVKLQLESSLTMMMEIVNENFIQERTTARRKSIYIMRMMRLVFVCFFEAIYFFLRQPTRTLKSFDRCGARRFHSSAIKLIEFDVASKWRLCCIQNNFYSDFIWNILMICAACGWIDILIDFKTSWNLNCKKSLFSDWKHRLVIKL